MRHALSWGAGFPMLLSEEQEPKVREAGMKMVLLGCGALWIVLFGSFVPSGCNQVTVDLTRRDCSDFTNTSCDECLANINCLWCYVDQRCMKYPVQSIIPPSSICPLRQARWGICWVYFEFLIIAMSVVGGLVLLPLVCCCCYCCCKKKVCCCCKKKSHGPDQEEVRLAGQQEERKQRNEERKAERRVRYDEICIKYGLIQNSDHPYGRFENE